MIRCVWKKERDGSFLFCFEPANDVVVDYGSTHKFVRGENRGFVKIVPTGSSSCEVTYVCLIDPGGFVPAWVSNLKIKDALSLAFELEERYKDRTYFRDAEERKAMTNIIRTRNSITARMKRDWCDESTTSCKLSAT